MISKDLGAIPDFSQFQNIFDDKSFLSVDLPANTLPTDSIGQIRKDATYDFKETPRDIKYQNNNFKNIEPDYNMKGW